MDIIRATIEFQQRLRRHQKAIWFAELVSRRYEEKGGNPRTLLHVLLLHLLRIDEPLAMQVLEALDEVVSGSNDKTSNPII